MNVIDLPAWNLSTKYKDKPCIFQQNLNEAENAPKKVAFLIKKKKEEEDFHWTQNFSNSIYSWW